MESSEVSERSESQQQPPPPPPQDQQASASVAIEIEPDVDKISAAEPSSQDAKNAEESAAKAATPKKTPHQARALSKNGVDLLVDRINSIFLLLVVPLFLVACIVLRINYQSIVYFVLLLILPFLYPVTEKTVSSEFSVRLTTGHHLSFCPLTDRLLLFFFLFLLQKRLASFWSCS